ncbi:hypothetical protein LEP1GSC008_4576 [Leptospira kirschneri serovar Bulgarica str. Nikolaevo]|uniref:Uncharacterized protein n=1 Tax=Leptospira kirschneri serovar Bulgarica str. Nikolaevo TaxID=1240687 RepID=M6FG36_9LEPT|nr:hypothetical protein LEP1GSC008_4576 [Leptospira kirschneri serovar Bulgarica str. Nikolaevo]
MKIGAVGPGSLAPVNKLKVRLKTKPFPKFTRVRRKDSSF